MAACVGNEFDDTLLQTLGVTDDLESALDDLIREGIIRLKEVLLAKAGQEDDESNVSKRYQFAHAKLRDTVLSWLSDEEQEANELKIGQALLVEEGESLAGSSLFTMLRFLNKTPSRITDAGQRKALAALNHKAALDSRSALSYEDAHDYALAGLEFLANDPSLEFDLLTLVAQTDYLRGVYDTMDKWQERMEPLATDDVAKLRMATIKVNALFTQSRHEEVLAFAPTFLKQYGISLKPKPKQLDVILALIPLRGQFNKFNLQASMEKGFEQDLAENLLIRLITRMMESAFFADQTMWAVLVAKTSGRIIKKGLTEQGTIVLASYGIIAVTAFGDAKAAEKLGNAIEQWVEKVESKRTRALLYFIYNVFLAHWYKPLADTITMVIKGLDEALASGDPEYASYNLNNAITNRYLSGVNWQEVYGVIEENLENLRLTQRKTDNYFTVVPPAQIAAMTTKEVKEKPWEMVGEHITEKDVEVLLNHPNKTTQFSFHLVKLSTAVRLAAWDAAGPIAVDAAPFMEYGKGTAVWKSHYLFLVPALLKSKSKDAMKEAQKAEKQYKKWYKNYPEVRAWYHAIQGMRLEAQNKPEAADAAFTKAVAEANPHNPPYIWAMIAEWAGEFHSAQGNTINYHSYLTEAYHGYAEAGMYAKMSRLLLTHPWLEDRVAHFNQEAKTSFTETVSLSSGDITSSLDMQSLLRTSAAIASEIAIDRFLERLMDIIIENAGATRGVLLLDRQGTIMVASQKDINDEEVALAATPLKDFEAVAHSVVQWVLNAGEVALLDDAHADDRFSQDPYLKGGSVRSVLCLPIMHQGKRTGLIYLENNLTVGAFAQQRIEFLKLLLGQIAISLENAILYEGLEEKVRERTKEITAQKEIIEKANISITDSINYALRIQEALLPARKLLGEIFPDSFVLFRPRDIVSGDFYWMAQKETEDGRTLTYLAAVDCTGHGVPGAFMSILGISSLDQIVDMPGMESPAAMLTLLETKIQGTMKREGADSHDGMDMVLVVYDHGAKELTFSGAVNPLVYFQHGEVNVIKGRRPGIGGGKTSKPFTDHKITVDTPTQVYLYSDGYQDQFGGPEGRKYMSKRLRETITGLHQKPFGEQLNTLETTLDEWQGNRNQVDDILLMGFEVK